MQEAFNHFIMKLVAYKTPELKSTSGKKYSKALSMGKHGL